MFEHNSKKRMSFSSREQKPWVKICYTYCFSLCVRSTCLHIHPIGTLASAITQLLVFQRFVKARCQRVTSQDLVIIGWGYDRSAQHIQGHSTSLYQRVNLSHLLFTSLLPFVLILTWQLMERLIHHNTLDLNHEVFSACYLCLCFN